MTRRTALSLLGFALIVAGSMYYIASLGVRLGPPSDRTTVSMTVGDANGLVVGSSVLIRGVAIGKVAALGQTTDGAQITFYFDGDYDIPIDSTVRLDNLSALGESYIAILPRGTSGPYLQDGQQIPTEHVIQPPSISDFAASIVRLLNQVDPKTMQQIIDQANLALPQDNSVRDRLSRASTLLASTIEAIPGRGRQTLDNMQTLLQNAGFVGPDIAAAGPSLGAIGPNYTKAITAMFDVIRTGIGGPDNIAEVGEYLARVQEFLDQSAPDIQKLSTTLLPGITAAASAAHNVDTAQLLAGALESISADGTITLRLRVPHP